MRDPASQWISRRFPVTRQAGLTMARLVVIGAGAMGLAAAYHAAKAGHQVDVLEAAPDAGGVAAHFDFDGLSIERFYHFVCKADQPTFRLLKELGLADECKVDDLAGHRLGEIIAFREGLHRVFFH